MRTHAQPQPQPQKDKKIMLERLGFSFLSDISIISIAYEKEGTAAHRFINNAATTTAKVGSFYWQFQQHC